MTNACRYLCSELVTVTYEQHPGEFCQTTANLEEISESDAVVLVDERLSLGAPRHLLAICEGSREGLTHAKLRALEGTRNTEENVPVDFVLSEA